MSKLSQGLSSPRKAVEGARLRKSAKLAAPAYGELPEVASIVGRKKGEAVSSWKERFLSLQARVEPGDARSKRGFLYYKASKASPEVLGVFDVTRCKAHPTSSKKHQHVIRLEWEDRQRQLAFDTRQQRDLWISLIESLWVPEEPKEPQQLPQGDKE